MEDFEPIKLLGAGSFGKVYLMKHSKTKDLVCTKVGVNNIKEATTVIIVQTCVHSPS